MDVDKENNKIEWNKVTWYSKLAAIIFFLAILPTLTFYIGFRYGQVKNQEETTPLVDIAIVHKTSLTPVYTDSSTTTSSEPNKGSVVVTEPKLEVVYPKGGEVFCKEKPTTIEWRAPSDMETVHVSLVVVSSSANEIGVYPAISEETAGSGRTIIPWNFKNAYGYTVADGNAYQIMISGTYHGKPITSLTPHIFTIQTCAGQ